MLKNLLKVSAGSLGLFMAASPALAQERSDTGRAEGKFGGEVSISQVFASDNDVVETEEGYGGSSTILRASLDYDLDFGASDVSVGYDTSAYFYKNDSRSDRWSNRVSAGVATAVSRALGLFGQISYANNIITTESSATDQFEALGRLQYSPDRSNRMRLFAGYRWRDYDADDSEGRGAVFGAEYRYRLASNHYLTADLRHEDIQSDALRRSYERASASLFYRFPVAEDLRLATGITARWWEFDSRFAPNGAALERRTYTPEIELRYATLPGVLLRGRAQYIIRSSNDPQFAGDYSRATLTAGYRF